MNNWTERLGPAKIKRPTSKRFSKISYFLELVKKKKNLTFSRCYTVTINLCDVLHAIGDFIYGPALDLLILYCSF